MKWLWAEWCKAGGWGIRAVKRGCREGELQQVGLGGQDNLSNLLKYLIFGYVQFGSQLYCDQRWFPGLSSVHIHLFAATVPSSSAWCFPVPDLPSQLLLHTQSSFFPDLKALIFSLRRAFTSGLKNSLPLKKHHTVHVVFCDQCPRHGNHKILPQSCLTVLDAAGWLCTRSLFIVRTRTSIYPVGWGGIKCPCRHKSSNIRLFSWTLAPPHQ